MQIFQIVDSIIYRKRQVYAQDDGDATDELTGSALGPDWAGNQTRLCGVAGKRRLHVVYNSELTELVENPNDAVQPSWQCRSENRESQVKETEKWSLYARLSDGQEFGCDMIVMAIGATPNSELWSDVVGYCTLGLL